jgi:hypothetical protein
MVSLLSALPSGYGGSIYVSVSPFEREDTHFVGGITMDQPYFPIDWPSLLYKSLFQRKVSGLGRQPSRRAGRAVLCSDTHPCTIPCPPPLHSFLAAVLHAHAVHQVTFVLTPVRCVDLYECCFHPIGHCAATFAVPLQETGASQPSEAFPLFLPGSIACLPLHTT